VGGGIPCDKPNHAHFQTPSIINGPASNLFSFLSALVKICLRFETPPPPES